MFGIVKTLVGYFAASVGVRLDVEHPAIRFVLAFFFFFFHQFLYWVMARALLGQQVAFETQRTCSGLAQCRGGRLAVPFPGQTEGDGVTGGA